MRSENRAAPTGRIVWRGDSPASVPVPVQPHSASMGFRPGMGESRPLGFSPCVTLGGMPPGLRRAAARKQARAHFSIGNLVFQGGHGLNSTESGHQNYTRITQALVDAVGEKMEPSALQRVPSIKNWCGKGDSNSHGFPHKILNLACLPFHHSRV